MFAARSFALVTLVAIVGIAACDAPAPPEPGSDLVPQFAASNNKFTFNNVTLPDGQTGEIEAGSRINNKSEITVCWYFTDDYGEWLG